MSRSSPSEVVDGVPVFRPSFNEFHDFYSYVQSINHHGMQSGIVKIIPPQEWLDMVDSPPRVEIIVFLPGVAEINRCCSLISARNDTFVVLPLHSALTPEEQRRVFKKYPRKRKIVVSTNIAETSITIDDCVATIDTGRGKTMIYNPRDNTTRLTESFISKAEAKQRRGRAGRVREGISYKLFSKRLYEEDMVSMPEPEIKRISLESLYISVKAMGIKDVEKFLGGGLDPPPTESIGKAARILTTVGLLDEFDGSLTELGKFISLMPTMDSKHGKLLIYSIIFGVADMGILLASILSAGTMPFVGGFENKDKIKRLLSKLSLIHI